MLPSANRKRGGRFAAVLLAAVVVAGPAAAADEWLVYVGGGLEAIEGGWEERRGQVVFRMRGGKLVSVPYADVDLPTSAFISWQLGGRRRPPPRAALPEEPPPVEEPPACVPARLVDVRSGETLEVATEGGGPEIVHLACLDAPETEHRYAPLGWFGRATLSAVEMAVRPGSAICLAEKEPPQRDREGHRVVFVTLADGRDFTGEVIAGGLGLLRPRACARAAHYRQIEDQAIAGQRGLWGGMAAEAAWAAADLAVSVVGRPSAAPMPRRSSGGGRG